MITLLCHLQLKDEETVVTRISRDGARSQTLAAGFRLLILLPGMGE